MPIEASSILGSLGGIGAIAKEVFGDPSTPPAAAPRRSAARAHDAAGQPLQPNHGALSHDRQPLSRNSDPGAGGSPAWCCWPPR